MCHCKQSGNITECFITGFINSLSCRLFRPKNSEGLLRLPLSYPILPLYSTFNVYPKYLSATTWPLSPFTKVTTVPPNWSPHFRSWPKPPSGFCSCKDREGPVPSGPHYLSDLISNSSSFTPIQTQWLPSCYSNTSAHTCPKAWALALLPCGWNTLYTALFMACFFICHLQSLCSNVTLSESFFDHPN